jgi:hypothetical protein
MSLVETRTSSVSRAPRPSSLADVLDLILDKGLVVDAYVRVSVAGIELLTIDARVVVASVDTYLRFAEAVNRLDLAPTEQSGIEALTGGGRQEDRQEDGEDEHGGDGRRAGEGGRGNRRADVGAGRGADADGDREGKHGGILERVADRARFEK